jgi:hypothetical protein
MLVFHFVNKEKHALMMCCVFLLRLLAGCEETRPVCDVARVIGV